MRIFDALWIAYQAEANPTWAYDYKAVIEGQTYAAAEMWTFGKTGGLVADDFGVGNCPIQQLSVSVTAKAGVTVGKNARTEVFVRIIGDSGTTLWHSLGVFFVDARKKLDGGKLQFECLDRMAYADVPFLTDGEALDDYPMPMDTAVARICTKIGTTLDLRSTISHTRTIDYPNDMSMRQVAAYIASAHGGNFCITEDDKLRLVVPGYGGAALAAISGSNAQKTFAGNSPTTFDSVAMIYSEDGSYYESGATKLHELQVTNPWATQAICDAVAAIIAGYTYTPYHANGADLDPAIELGDHITIDGKDCNLWKWTWTNRLYCDIECPSKTDDTTSEFGYTGTLTSALGKKLTLGASYYGTTISKAEGLKIAKSDGSSKLVFNSDTLSWQVTQDGSLVDRLYFDAVAGDLRYNGTFGVAAIEAMKANIDVIISNTIIVQNLYAQKGVIAELTVDQLDTSDKVTNYLNHDTSPVKYLKIHDDTIEFFTATTTGVGTEQLTDRKGNPVYWIDGTFQGITTDVTAWPVLTYIYTETLDLTIDGSDGAAWTGTNISDSNIAFSYDDGTVSNYVLTKDAAGKVTAVNGIPITWNTSSGGVTPAPLLVSNAVVGTAIALLFDSTMSSPAGKQAEFTATVNGVARAITAAALGSPATIIDLTLATPTVTGDTIQITFTKGTVTSAAGGSLASFGPTTLYNANSAPSYQVWSLHQDSPVLTTDYPYQAILTETTSPHALLITSKYKLYNSGSSLTNVRGDFKVYYIGESSTWELYSSSMAILAYSAISECNADIYTSSALSAVFKAKTV